jgi:hypothetical protein
MVNSHVGFDIGWIEILIPVFPSKPVISILRGRLKGNQANSLRASLTHVHGNSKYSLCCNLFSYGLR